MITALTIITLWVNRKLRKLFMLGRSYKLLAGVVAVLALIQPANAGRLLASATIDYQPIVTRDALGFSECGIRVIAGYGSDTDGYLYDVSLFAQRKHNFAIVSGQRYKVSSSGPVPVMPLPTRFWIAQASDGVPLIANPVTASDDRTYATGALDTEKTLTILTRMVNGQEVHFNLTADVNDSSALSFALPIRPAVMETLSTCLSGMVKNLGK